MLSSRTIYSMIRFVPRGMFALSSRGMSSEGAAASAAGYSFETLKVTTPGEYVFHVEVNRPEKRNAQNKAFYREMSECFHKIADDSDCRAVVLSGAGKIFSAGLDIMSVASDLMSSSDQDPGRRAISLRKFVFSLQDSFNAIEQCPKPVIAAVHGACIGGGVDLISACDIRYTTQDAYFQIKEVDIGLAADLGSLQRFPKIVGNHSLTRELAYTGRKLLADEAKSIGLTSRVFEDKDAMMTGALELAAEISSKSPIAVQGTKINLNYSRDHSVAEGMEYAVTWNQGMLQSEDLMKAGQAAMQKETATFSKL